MVIPGAALFMMGFVYYRWTKDFPQGNIDELRKKGLVPVRANAKGSFREALKDYRVWALAVMYGASFGVELTIDNVAALYFTDKFHLSLVHAGLVAGSFGLMNIFARTLGGVFSDRVARKTGLKGRVAFLGTTLLVAGILIMVFSKMNSLALAIASMVIFALFIKMANGANYAIVPFVNKRALGAVAGIVGAGGNLGAVSFGFLFRNPSISYETAMFYLGCLVAVMACAALAVRFSPELEKETKEALETAQAQKLQLQTA